MLDLLITNGMIVDGTGNPGFYGAVAVTGDEVEIVRGDVSQVQAARTIDASGKVVCPGFIDMHAHSDVTMLDDPNGESKAYPVGMLNCREMVIDELGGVPILVSW